MIVLCIGHASMDISMYTYGFPKENEKYRLKEMIESPGGPALTASLLLGKWGVNTYYEGLIGKDEEGLKILKSLKENNVKTDYVQVDENVQTTKTFIIINKNNASRTLFNKLDDYNEKPNKEITITPDIILMDAEHYELSKDAITKFPNAIKVIDAGKLTKSTILLAKVSDYIICSKEFAEITTKIKIDYNNPSTLKNILNKMNEIYNGQVIITSEEKGCLYKLDNKIKLMSALKVKAVDTTGAGDIFHGAFVYGLSKNLPLEKCLKIANIAAGLSVKKQGSAISIPEVEEVHRIYEKNR